MKKIFPDLSPIGYIQKTLGFDGVLQLSLEVDTVEKMPKPEYLWFLQYGKPVPFSVLKFKLDSKVKAQIVLEDISDEQTAMQLKGLTCLIEDEVYDKHFVLVESYNYILDFSVSDEEHGDLGIVVDIMENDNGHDNLVVVKEELEIMIPFVDHIILEINEDTQEIKVKLPEGLMELFTQK